MGEKNPTVVSLTSYREAKEELTLINKAMWFYPEIMAAILKVFERALKNKYDEETLLRDLRKEIMKLQEHREHG